MVRTGRAGIHPILVCHSMGDEGGLHPNGPHFPNANETLFFKVVSCGGCLNSSPLYYQVPECTRVMGTRTVLHTFFPCLVRN